MTHARRDRWSAVLGLAALISASPLAAQDAVIRGRIMSDRNEPILGAAVSVEELRMVVRSNAQGDYAIVVPAARVSGQAVTLRVRAIAFKPANRALTLSPGEQRVDVTLTYDVNLLEALVVTGVQEATEQVKTPFSVQSVSAAQMPVTAADPLTQIKGKVPGAEIVSSSGRPGAAPAVLLRGPTEINAQGRGQDPLYIVDGVIINGSLPDLNPSDIENIEVVEGAAGASLYGARAGNGVINITTKSGRQHVTEGVTFSVHSEGGVNDIERDFGLARFQALMMDETGTRFCQFVSGQPACARTFDYHAEAARINNAIGDFALPAAGFPVDPGATINGPALRQRFQIEPWPGTAYNAVAQVVQPHPYNQNTVDMTGRFGGTTFYTSASNLMEQGAIRYLQGFRRYSFRANVDQTIGANWTVAVRSFYSRSSEDGLNQEGGGTAFFRLTRVPAVVNVLQTDTLGRLFIRPNLQGGGSQNENPLYSLQNIDRSDVTDRFIGGGDVQWAPVPWVTVDAQLSYDLRRTQTLQFLDKGFRTTTSNPGTNNGSIFRADAGDEALNTSLNATFRHDFSPDLKTHYTLRYSYQDENLDNTSGSGNFLATKGITALANATANLTPASSTSEIKQIGYFAGAGVDYKDRYIIDLLLRRDGSSLFGVDHRYATGGRASAAWIPSREPFWPVPQLTSVKLHASYGTAVGSPQFSAQYEAIAIGAGGALTLNLRGNPSLGPELHKEVELGADLELLSKYALSVTYAHAKIDDQILPVPVSAGTGFQTQWQNAGALDNKTWELSLNVPFIQQRDLSWSMRVIYDRNRSVITRLDVQPFFYGATLQATDQIFLAKVGQRIGTFYGRKFVTSCSELPAPYNAQCGPGKDFQRNDEGWIVWVGAGNNPGMGITNNLWETQLPGGSAPWGVAMNWGMPIILRGAGTNGQSAQSLPLGNALPDFRFAVTQNFTWKRFSLYALVDASIGQKVWDQGFGWAHLDFLSKDVDQNGKSVQNAKPIGYYYRAAQPDNGNGLGGLYDILGPNNFSVESASYAKLREFSLSYHIGPLGGAGDWSVSAIGRNLFTITGYRGFDPEVGLAGGQASSAAINAVDAFTFPNVRSWTIGLSSSF